MIVQLVALARAEGCDQFGTTSLDNSLGCLESLQQSLLTTCANARDLVEDALRLLLRATISMEGDTKAVRLVTDMTDHLERFRAAVQDQRLRLARTIELFEALRKTEDAHFVVDA